MAIPPRIPAMTICRTLRLKTDPLWLPSVLVVISATPYTLIRVGVSTTAQIIADVTLERRRETSPAAVHQHVGPGDVGARPRSQVQHRPDHERGLAGEIEHRAVVE